MSLSLFYSGIFRSLDWRLFTDVSGEPISVIFKSKVIAFGFLFMNAMGIVALPSFFILGVFKFAIDITCLSYQK